MRTGKYTLYVLECLSGDLYVGITNNLLGRLEQHYSRKGAIVTRRFGVKDLLYSKQLPYVNKWSAMREEDYEVLKLQKQHPEIQVYGGQWCIPVDKVFYGHPSKRA